MIDNREEVINYYQSYLNTFNQNELKVVADVELESRMIEVFGSASIEDALTDIQNNPSDYVDGLWGFSHGALSVSILYTLWITTQDVPTVLEEAFYQKAYWYTRESIARCSNSDADNHRNPLTWSEDSRLDYWTPFVFIDWFLNEIQTN